MIEHKYSAREFIDIFCGIYSRIGQKPLSLSVESIHEATGLDRPLCKSIVLSIKNNPDLNTELRTKILKLIPLKVIAKANRVKVKELKENVDPEERRLLCFAADKIVKMFKTRYPKKMITYATKQTLNSMAKTYSFDTIQKVVEYAFNSEFWGSRITTIYDLNKVSKTTKKKYIDTIIEQIKQEESELNFVRTAQI